MLPSSKDYLIECGFTESKAAWILLGCFVGGFVGIQIVSRFLHHHIPSQVVDCDHDHKETPHGQDHHVSRGSSQTDHHSRRQSGHTPAEANGRASESTPLLPTENGAYPKLLIPIRGSSQVGLDGPRSRGLSEAANRRPSMIEVPSRVMSYIAEQIRDQKPNCDEGGPCFGYSEPCGQECFKYLAVRSPTARTPTNSRHNTFFRSATNPYRQLTARSTLDGDLDNVSTQAVASPTVTRARSHDSAMSFESEGQDLEAQEAQKAQKQHHHHVPENAFMNIGLQTSIAIALHKIPEGFITYATNHANPSLGFSVFMALFVHNITEGFALALPLYLALHSRFRAMFWASLLGGVSQPLGAGVAAAWFKVAGHEQNKPGSEVYGCMFAVTAGIMTSVALQLFVEGLGLNHNRNLCIAFAFIGMAIMAMSNALTSG